LIVIAGYESPLDKAETVIISIDDAINPSNITPPNNILPGNQILDLNKFELSFSTFSRNIIKNTGEIINTNLSEIHRKIKFINCKNCRIAGK
jgi:hypothetical protein